MAEQFKNLFSPIKIGKTTVKNRIVLSAHNTNFVEAAAGGGVLSTLGMALPGKKQIAYWEERARGGLGMLITRAYPVSTDLRQDVFHVPEALSLFKQVPPAIHEHGVALVAQLVNSGNQLIGPPTELMEVPSVSAPSAVAAPSSWRVPHVLTIDEIKKLLAAFGEAAALVREAGFDGIEIHGANGYLPQQFMSPFTNRRTDDYGGSLENRLRFPLELIDSIRSAVGDDFMVGMRISGDEFFEGGYTLEDMLVMAPRLTGKLDYLNVSQGSYRATLASIVPPMHYPLGVFVYLGAAVKKVVDIPVLCSGRINDPVQAEQLLEDNQMDMVAMARALICDPEWPKKAKEGRLEDIRKCIACNEGCGLRRRHPGGITCALNPVVGRGQEWRTIQPADRKKQVMVIGGGPAGLEAARVAALRGHQVSLYEKCRDLGGKTRIAAKAPGRADFDEVSRYFTHQVKTLGVEVHLDTEATVDMVRKLRPDALVLATGSLPNDLFVPGAEQRNVVEAKDVLAGKVEVGQNVVVIDDEHHSQALGAADYLASRGRRVEIICQEYFSGSKIDGGFDINIYNNSWPVYKHLFEAGATFSPHTLVKEIRGNTVVAANVFTMKERLIEGVDTVVYAAGDRENNALYLALKDEFKEVYTAGDCNGVRRLVQAVYEGAKVGRAV